jgi:hypothetical protein
MINIYPNLNRWLGVLNLSVEFKILLSTIILTLISLIGANGFESAGLAYGQFFETNSSDLTSNSTSSQSDDSNAADIVLLSQKLKKSSFGYRHLVGQVKNIGNDTGSYVRIDLTTYDKNGDVLGTDFTYATANTLKPNQKSSFDLGSSSDNFKGMKYYELSLQWNNEDGTDGYVENAKIFKANSTNTND